MILAPAGGVGGAKLANGLAQIPSPDDLFTKHCQEALRLGLVPSVHINAHIAFDVEAPSDLMLWSRARRIGSSAQFHNRSRSATG